MSRERLKALAGKARQLLDKERKARPHARARLARPLPAQAEARRVEEALSRVPAQAAPRQAAGSPDPRPPYAQDLAAFEKQICGCLRCPLGATRKSFVFGAGNPKAELVFVGEAPGAEEDLEGEPFVGAAGKLLTKIIGAMGMRREDVYILNVLKCRPPGNRDPLPAEVEACRPYLEQQIRLIGPKAICTLGNHATRALLGTEEGISRLRGRFFEWQGVPLMPTYHPAALLRNEGLKRQVWDDMKALLARLKDAK